MLNGYTGMSSGGTTPYVGTFSTQTAGVFSGAGACNGLTANITDFLSCEAAGGTVTVAWAATETPTATPVATPEPMGIALLGSILLGLAPYLRRLRRA